MKSVLVDRIRNVTQTREHSKPIDLTSWLSSASRCDPQGTAQHIHETRFAVTSQGMLCKAPPSAIQFRRGAQRFYATKRCETQQRLNGIGLNCRLRGHQAFHPY